ncbi:MAG: tetratricopeptide repeat protein, partial [Gammaproteobacteria bacterium]|nr:tetratricopeptide repeat protein [Gammaproteobacteria bacterium]
FEADEKTDFREQISGGDDTELSQLAPADDTAIEEQAAAHDDTRLEGRSDVEDKTDVSIPPATVADLERLATEQDNAAQQDDGDEDMSLLLVDRDQTNLTSPTSATDPRTPEQMNALRAEDAVDDGLALVDTTRHQLPGEETAYADTTAGSATATTGIAQDTRTSSATMTATETSTRTYAPDNYDRTLMRLPSDDASKLFAGMKSDSDVVMTPDYAKKVFRSKSSAQRMQNYKVYSGIAIAILLAIGIYGAFEYQDESNSIDASLRPLKRDPMPGVIKPAGEEKDINLFPETTAQAEITERTIELVENAGVISAEVVVEEEIVTETAATAATTTERAVVVQQAGAGATAAASSAGTRDRSAQGSGTGDASLASSASAASGNRTGSSTLQISSSSRVEEKSRWLREAYAAYQAGNDDLAMSLYNKVLEMDPGNRNALLARAAINVQNNNSRAAIRDYQTILLANPTDSLAMASMISVANFSPAETESQLKLMIRDEPDSPYLNFALANIYGAQKRWQEAQRLYFKALQNNPGDPNYAYNLAVSLEHIAQPGAAMTYYQRALDNFDNGLATFSREVVDQRLEILAKL